MNLNKPSNLKENELSYRPSEGRKNLSYIYCSLYTANHYIAASALSAAPSSALPFLINYLKLIFY